MVFKIKQDAELRQFLKDIEELGPMKMVGMTYHFTLENSDGVEVDDAQFEVQPESDRHTLQKRQDPKA